MLVRIKPGLLELEDMTAGMVRPCVLDVKLNCVGHSRAKQAIVKRKYLHTTVFEHGFRICGLQFYKSQDNFPTFYSKSGSRCYDSSTTLKRLKEFFRADEGEGYPLLVSLAIARVDELIASLRKTWGFRFFSTSLLLAYDAVPNSHVKAKLIDFGRVAEVHADEQDEVVIASLQSFKQFLEAI
jgi:hypothetical protein